ncbi:uncharacterized protein BXZ73DRAFT_78915 [Epithele typhae]|uniref:uncharacterized protein n=1 Tax=Epithele typhae TaxID=378194 RepID=UPI002007CEA5|nr:uncharacterized protein BXZ73DRAFT_78915 [Epithele typhae]KAH9925940.1 hypothetical protein BXZ73DRAFT_78915 [Epithele typhae]
MSCSPDALLQMAQPKLEGFRSSPSGYQLFRSWYNYQRTQPTANPSFNNVKDSVAWNTLLSDQKTPWCDKAKDLAWLRVTNRTELAMFLFATPPWSPEGFALSAVNVEKLAEVVATMRAKREVRRAKRPRRSTSSHPAQASSQRNTSFGYHPPDEDTPAEHTLRPHTEEQKAVFNAMQTLLRGFTMTIPADSYVARALGYSQDRSLPAPPQQLPMQASSSPSDLSGSYAAQSSAMSSDYDCATVTPNPTEPERSSTPYGLPGPLGPLPASPISTPTIPLRKRPRHEPAPTHCSSDTAPDEGYARMAIDRFSPSGSSVTCLQESGVSGDPIPLFGTSTHTNESLPRGGLSHTHHVPQRVSAPDPSLQDAGFGGFDAPSAEGLTEGDVDDESLPRVRLPKKVTMIIRCRNNGHVPIPGAYG